PPAVAAPAEVPARRRADRVQRSRDRRHRRPRGSRPRALPRITHDEDRRPRGRLPAPRIRRGQPALPAGRAARSNLEISGRRGRRRAPLREMAEGLLRLYAERAVADGHAFAADSPWQREFETAFRFEETPDQLRAIEEAKKDMESDRPMDRLVAGDVGYGKTEVAL